MTVETQQASNFNPGFLPLFCLLSVLLFYVWRRRPRLFPPGPKGLPVVGVIPFLYRDPPRMLRDWSNKYGSVMAVRMGRNEVIVLSGYKTIQEAFVTKSDAFSGRPYSLVMHKIFHKNLGLSFLDYNQTWKGQRQFGIRALKGVGIGRKSIESRIMEEMEYYVEWLVKMEGKPINLRTFLTSAVANVIANIMFGRRFEYNSEELQKIVDIFEESFSLGSTGALFYMTMFESSLRFVPPFRGAYLKISANLDYMRDFIRRHISTHVESFDKNDYRDFCDAFYAEMTKEGNQSNGDFHMEQLVHVIQDLLVAGFETTTSTLLWGVLCLLHHEDSKSKIFNEIKNVIGEGGFPQLRHRLSMPYTMAFIEEINRFRAVVPITPSHKTTREVEIDGYVIPKNTEVIGNLWSVQHDPEIWHNPEQFIPERHLTSDGKFASSDKILAFSLGPRRCPGEDIAKAELFLFLVSLLQKFTLHADPNSKSPPSVHNGCHGSAFVPSPFEIIVNQRR